MPWPLLKVGTRLGDKSAPEYEVVEELGGGAFGRVFKVQSLNVESEVHAFKTLHDDAGLDPSLQEYKALFKREADIWIGLEHHDHLVQATSYREFPNQNGRPFLVLEYIRGKNLRSVLGSRSVLADERAAHEGGHLAPVQALDYAVGICRGMANVRRQENPDLKLIHRDLSPDNVLIEATGNRAKVADFGISKYQGEKTGGHWVGKTPYIAPECTVPFGVGTDRSEAVDWRSDLYSFGVMFYRMLSGSFPIKFNNDDDLFSIMIKKRGQPRPLRDCLPADVLGLPGASRPW